ncbi:DUF4838 domain-containing protein [Desertivirga xinjiangensis]|uniref:DUF4838 domain-containing protein n=1 Tax=Desertivirga xinjiangensis TaxID=539206 RepID=UPI00210BC279|nr:DUF4838 domain-containing protein [Pedobacter xinjiangensis]
MKDHLTNISAGLVLLAFLLLSTNKGHAAEVNRVLLASKGKAMADIIAEGSVKNQLYAISELNKYLSKISKAKFDLKDKSDRPSIRLVSRNFSNPEAYDIEIKGKDVVLAAGSDRATLYAVYDFLERLGCHWIAPNFEYYEHSGEVIPVKNNLVFTLNHKVSESPDMEYRKLDVAGSRTLATEKLKKLIEWMPKGRYNTLRFAMDRENGKPVKWDKYRLELTPELKKRGILIEVGGHGYQHFLSGKMESGELFKNHPDWFGKDSTCKPSPSDRLVFNTENPQAVKYFTEKIIQVVKNRPEIDIFDLWPPDVGHWQDCPDQAKFGTPQERQVRLANHVYQEIKKVRPDIRMEIIAYSNALFPPEKTTLHKDILLEICPINQSFEKQIDDPSASTNAEYIRAIKEWRDAFSGNITLYSYYRKQAWRSAPVVIPFYMQKDMQYFASVPMQGIACYAETNDWFTYELNHFALGRLGWNPDINIDSLSSEFFSARYGKEQAVAADSYQLLEETVRLYGSIPFTSLKTKEEIKEAQEKVGRQIIAIKRSRDNNPGKGLDGNFSRLLLMYDYLDRDLEIQYARVSGASREKIYKQIKEFVSFMQSNLDKGVFILTGSDDFGRFTKKYGLTNQSLLD